MKVGECSLETRNISLIELPKSRHLKVILSYPFLILKWLAALNCFIGELPKLDGLIIRREHQKWVIGPMEPFDWVDSLLNINWFEVVEVLIVALDLCNIVKFLVSFLGFLDSILLEYNQSSSHVAESEMISCLAEGHRSNNVFLVNLICCLFLAKKLRELPFSLLL